MCVNFWSFLPLLVFLTSGGGGPKWGISKSQYFSSDCTPLHTSYQIFVITCLRWPRRSPKTRGEKISPSLDCWDDNDRCWITSCWHHRRSVILENQFMNFLSNIWKLQTSWKSCSAYVMLRLGLAYFMFFQNFHIFKKIHKISDFVQNLNLIVPFEFRFPRKFDVPKINCILWIFGTNQILLSTCHIL